MNRGQIKKPGLILRRARPVAQYAAVLLISLNLNRLPPQVASWPGFQAPRALLMLWTALLLFLAWRSDRHTLRMKELDRAAGDRRETRLLTYLAWSVPALLILDAVAVAHFYDCWFRSGSEAAAEFSRLSPVLMAVGCVLWIYGMQVRRLPFRSIWGLRLSSTLASEEAWKQAHSRLMLPLLLAGAFCLILGTILP